MFLRIPIPFSDFISAKKASKRLGITSRRIRVLAQQGRVSGAFKHAKKGWLFPKSGIEVAPGKRGPGLSFAKRPG